MELTFTDELPAIERKQSGVPGQLKKNKGKWAIIRSYPLSRKNAAGAYANAVRTGKTRVWSPAGDFKAAVRSMGDEIVVWARYVGGEAS